MNVDVETTEAEPDNIVKRVALPDEKRAELCMLEARLEAKVEEHSIEAMCETMASLVPRKGITMLTLVVTCNALVINDLLLLLPVIVEVSAIIETLEMLT